MGKKGREAAPSSPRGACKNLEASLFYHSSPFSEASNVLPEIRNQSPSPLSLSVAALLFLLLLSSPTHSPPFPFSPNSRSSPLPGISKIHFYLPSLAFGLSIAPEILVSASFSWSPHRTNLCSTFHSIVVFILATAITSIALPPLPVFCVQRSIPPPNPCFFLMISSGLLSFFLHLNDYALYIR